MEHQAIEPQLAEDLISNILSQVFSPAARIHACSMKITVDVEEASLLTGIPMPSLNKMRSEGVGPAYIKIGSRVYYDPNDLREFMRKGRKIVS